MLSVIATEVARDQRANVSSNEALRTQLPAGGWFCVCCVMGVRIWCLHQQCAQGKLGTCACPGSHPCLHRVQQQPLPACLPLFVAQSITIYEEKTFFPFHTSQTEEVRSEAEEFCSSWVIASGQMTASNSELCVTLPFHAVLVVSMTVRAPVCLCSLWGTVCACNPPYVAMSNRERKSDPWKLMFSMLI